MTVFGKIGCVLLISFSAGAVLSAYAGDEFQAQSKEEAPVTNTVLRHTESVLGKDIVASGKSAGRIVDVLTDKSGQVRAVVVEFGGFLGVGGRKIAIAWSDLRFDRDGGSDVVAVDLSRDRLSGAPEVRAGKPVIVISARASASNRAGAD